MVIKLGDFGTIDHFGLVEIYCWIQKGTQHSTTLPSQLVVCRLTDLADFYGRLMVESNDDVTQAFLVIGYIQCF